LLSGIRKGVKGPLFLADLVVLIALVALVALLLQGLASGWMAPDDRLWLHHGMKLIFIKRWQDTQPTMKN
jgi:hypothetical protein